MASSPPRPRPRRPTAAAAAASSTTTSSSSVVALTAEDLLDTAASATTAVDSRTRWPEASGTKSILVLKPLHHGTPYHIPDEHYTLLSAKDWVACDAPPEGYNMVCAYAAAFKAGMRLPFHDLHAAVLRHYGLAPSQLMPNAWRYLNAFVLLCEDARVQPTLPVFLFFFVLCAEKESMMGRYHFRPRRYPLSSPAPPMWGAPSSSRHCRLFTGKMPHSPWKHRFFFIQAPSWMPWPCPLMWGAPSKASVREPPLLTNDASEEAKAVRKLLHLAGDTGIDILKFLSVRNPPVGHLQQIPAAASTPQRSAVKQEANAAAAAGSEQTRKRKLPEPNSNLQSLPDCSAPVLAGSCSRKRLHYFAQEALAEFDAKEQELQMAKIQYEADVAQLKQALAAAKVQHEADVVHLKQEHAADLSLLKDEVQNAKAEASQSAEEVQNAKAEASRSAEKAQADHVAKVREITSTHHRQRIGLQQENSRLLGDFYNKGVRDTKELVLSLYGDALDLSEFTDTNLLFESTPPPGIPQLPQN